MEISATRRVLSRNRRILKKVQRKCSKESLLQSHLYYLASLDDRRQNKTDARVKNEFSDIVSFRSTEEANKFMADTGRRRVLFCRAKLPPSPDIPEEAFTRVQKSIQRKTAEETLQDYFKLTLNLKNVPDEVHEQLAENIYDTDDLQDSEDDSDDTLSEEEAEVTSEIEESDYESVAESSVYEAEDNDFTLIEDTDSSAETVEPSSSSGGDGDAFEIHSRLRRKTLPTPKQDSVDGSKRCAEALLLRYPFVRPDCSVQLHRLEDSYLQPREQQEDDLKTLSSVFNPPSCSTSIGETSFGNEAMRNRLEDLDETIQPTKDITTVVDVAELASEQTQLNLAHGESTIRAYLNLSLHRDEVSNESATQSKEHTILQQTPKSNRGMPEKKTPSNMLRNLSLASAASSVKSSPTSTPSQTETPIRKRLRELGILQKLARAERHRSTELPLDGTSGNENRNRSTLIRRHSDINSAKADSSGQSSMMKRFASMDIASTPKKRSCNSNASLEKKRTVQVFATPSRPIRTLEDALAPTMSLGHIVKFYSASRHYLPFATNSHYS